MTNLLSIPRIDGANTSFVVARNADWVDSIFFAAPGSAGPVVLVGCAFTAGANAITVPSTVNLGPGMPISQAPGIPAGAYIGSVTSSTAITMVDSNNSELDATATNAYATLTFQPLPLDLSGISFLASLRLPANSPRVFLTAQTGDGSMVNGGTSGMLRFNVPQARMGQVPVGGYVVDILASDGVNSVNLLPVPASVTVNAGAADATLRVS